MLSRKWRDFGKVAHQIGFFLLLLMDSVIPEEVKTDLTTTEKNYNIDLSYLTTERPKDVDGNVNYDLDPTYPPPDVDGNIDPNYRRNELPRDANGDVNYNIDPSFQRTRRPKDVNGNVAARPRRPTRLPSLNYKSRAVIRSFLLRHRIIPEVLAIAPKFVMEIMYTRNSIVNFGNRIDPSRLQSRPRSVVWPWREGSFYTLIFVDADVPARGNRKYSQRIQWLVVNIPGQDINKGDHAVEYIGPLAPPQTGMHRYIFAVFRQNGQIVYNGTRIKATENKLSFNRIHFSIRDYAAKNKLKDPIAVNFFLSGWPLDQPAPEFRLPTTRRYARRPWTTSLPPTPAST